MELKKLVFPSGIISLFITVITLLYYSKLVIYVASFSLVMFLIEVFFIKERHEDPIGLVIIVLIIIILFKILSL